MKKKLFIYSFCFSWGNSPSMCISKSPGDPLGNSVPCSLHGPPKRSRGASSPSPIPAGAGPGNPRPHARGLRSHWLWGEPSPEWQPQRSASRTPSWDVRVRRGSSAAKYSLPLRLGPVRSLDPPMAASRAESEPLLGRVGPGEPAERGAEGRRVRVCVRGGIPNPKPSVSRLAGQGGLGAPGVGGGPHHVVCAGRPPKTPWKQRLVDIQGLGPAGGDGGPLRGLRGPGSPSCPSWRVVTQV